MHKRIAIAGIPKSGKTTLANNLSDNAVHTDDFIHLGWSEQSLATSLLFDKPGPLIIEGVTIPRALRKWLQHHPEGKPVDQAVFLNTPHIPLSPGQQNMAKGCRTVWLKILPELLRRGVIIGEEGIVSPTANEHWDAFEECTIRKYTLAQRDRMET